MDTAASLLQLIQFTIISIRVIRETSIAIKDGPETISYMAKSANHLLHIMERLEKSHALKQYQTGQLHEMVRSCHVDVRRMAMKLEKYDFKASDNFGIKMRKIVLGIFNEKEWMDFRLRMDDEVLMNLHSNDKLHDIGDTSIESHKVLREDLVLLSEKCDRIEATCNEVQIAIRQPKPGDTFFIDSIRRIIQEDLKKPILNEISGISQGNISEEIGERISKAFIRLEGRSDSKFKTLRSDLEELAALANELRLFQARAHAESNNQISRHRGTVTAIEKSDWPADKILADSLVLEKFFPRDRIRLKSVAPKYVMVNRQTLLRLLEWTGGKAKYRVLWINSPHNPARDSENPMTRLSSKLLKISENVVPKLPILSFFCQPSKRRQNLSDETSEMEGLIAMLYALIRQIIEIQPPGIRAVVDLPDNRLRDLDGTEKTWKASLCLLEDLISGLEKAFLIVDGFHWVEHSSTRKCLGELLDVLLREKLHSLFVTTGHSPSLMNKISQQDTLSDRGYGFGGPKEDIDRHQQKLWT
ncbi:hypothetical protein HYFRA_00009521 [Hymenoscyphus fraxineus]|uniref:Fungal N-terminal domain-containing protein n=1 Tax=Hymenoscyphus fraxineus TaxID=746836 RepID=A0A9N9PVG4_9HELO|nr:hypothetical protein HYFRA_00009521 [Hymenoscyphus fraxineus]